MELNITEVFNAVAPMVKSIITWGNENMENIAERLEYLRAEIIAERISYAELAELQSLAEHIAPGDVLLLEWAGVPEFNEEE